MYLSGHLGGEGPGGKAENPSSRSGTTAPCSGVAIGLNSPEEAISARSIQLNKFHTKPKPESPKFLYQTSRRKS